MEEEDSEAESAEEEKENLILEEERWDSDNDMNKPRTEDYDVDDEPWGD